MAVESLKKRAAKGAFWITVEMAGVQATSFVVFVAMAHFVSPSDFGLISISFIAIQSLKSFFLDNISTAIIRKQQATDLEYTTAFWLALAVSFICFLLLFISSDVIARLFHTPALTHVLRAMSIVILFMGLARTHEAWLSRHFMFRSLALRGIGGAVVSAIIGLWLAAKGYGVMALVGQQISISVVSTALLWMTCPWRPGFHISMETVREIFHFMRRMIGNVVVYIINQNCDTFLVAFFFGPVSAGIYNVGKRIRFTLQQVISTPLNSVSFPVLAELQDDPARLRRAMLSSLTLIFIVCAPAFFGISAVSDEAIAVLFGQKWAGAAPVLELLAIGGLIAIVLTYNENIFIMKHRPVWAFYVSLLYSVLAIVAFFACSHLHIHSIALPFVLPYCIVFPVSALLISRRTDFSALDWLRSMFPGVVSSIFMFVAIRLLAPHLTSLNNLERLIMLSFAGAIIYGGVLLLIGRKSLLMLAELVRHTLQQGS